MKRSIKTLILLLIPVAAVLVVKQTSWGPILAAPKAREIGNASAKVTIVEYSDFQCPMCAAMQPTVHSLLGAYDGKVRFVYKYFPLTRIHRNAMSAAHSAECAAAQNKFWPYADSLFKNQKSWAELTDPTTWYTTIADQSQLNRTQFDSCQQDPSKDVIINHDADEARSRDVNATPTFFVGDQRLVGGIFASEGAQAIERELRR